VYAFNLSFSISSLIAIISWIFLSIGSLYYYSEVGLIAPKKLPRDWGELSISSICLMDDFWRGYSDSVLSPLNWLIYNISYFLAAFVAIICPQMIKRKKIQIKMAKKRSKWVDISLKWMEGVMFLRVNLNKDRLFLFFFLFLL